MDLAYLVGQAMLGAVGGLVIYVAANYYLDRSTPLHVKCAPPRLEVCGLNILPAFVAVLKALPRSTRINFIAKQGAPKKARPDDWFDWFGENPYEIAEVVPGKIWRVKYCIENIFAFSPAEDRQLMGIDYENKKTADRVIQAAQIIANKQLIAQVEKDLVRATATMKLIKEKGKTKETVRAAGRFTNNMVIVRLNNGDVLLYSPVEVREEFGFADWLESIGPVKWIVLGSSAHTLQLPSIMKRYPDANYVSSMDAWIKLVEYPGGIHKSLPDFNYNNPHQLTKLNNILKDEGVVFHYVVGDEASQALIGIAHQTALEVDIIYSSCGGGFMTLSDKQFWKLQDKDIDARLFKLAVCSSPVSPNNALPPYRFWSMDADGLLGAMLTSSLKKDGSSCTDMANSLRAILKEDFDHAVGVHFDYMTGEDFRKSVDMNWRWLDGKSLL